jgi:hypothetical protein
MGSYSSTQKAFSGDGKVHGSSIVMAEFKREDYNRILRKLGLIANRMTLRKAINLAAKRAADTGVAESKRQISSEYTLPASEIGKRVKRYAYGSPLDMAIGIKISDTARPLSEFNFSPKKPVKKPITVEVKRGDKTVFSKGAFVQRMPNTGHIGIFEREDEERLPIRELPGPSVTGMFKANESIHNDVWDKIFETFDKRVVHELHRLLDG